MALLGDLLISSEPALNILSLAVAPNVSPDIADSNIVCSSADAACVSAVVP